MVVVVVSAARAGHGRLFVGLARLGAIIAAKQGLNDYQVHTSYRKKKKAKAERQSWVGI